MKSNYSTKKYTTRVKPVSATQMQKIRESKLAQAKTSAERRFINSQKFESTIRANVRSNRATANRARLEKIATSLGKSREQQQTIRQIFGVKTYARGKDVVQRNTMTSQSQYNKLKKIEKAISASKFDIKKYVVQSRRYKEVKQYLPKNATLGDYLTSLNRTQFYFENKKTIMQYNDHAMTHGQRSANRSAVGQKLADAYRESLNESEIDLVDKFFK